MKISKMIRGALSALPLVFGSDVAQAGGAVRSVSLRLNATQPVYLKFTSEGVGPRFQCTFGEVQEGVGFFEKIHSTRSLRRRNMFQFSEVFEYRVTGGRSTSRVQFVSQLNCQIIDEPPLPWTRMTRPGRVSVRIFQDPDKILLADEFNGFVREIIGGDVWKTAAKSPAYIVTVDASEGVRP